MRRRILSACLLTAICVSPAQAELPNPQLAARYKQLLRAHPQPGIALDRLWKMYEDAGQLPALLGEYEQAQTSFSGALLYGYFLEHADRDADAKAAFAKAAALDAKNAAPWMALAQLASDPAEAAFSWQKAATLEPTLATLLALGNAWQLAHDPQKASAAWEQAAALDPGDLALQTQLAANYEQQHLPEQALAHYRVIATNGDPAQRAPALQNVARVLEALGKTDEATQALDQALGLVAPGNWLRGPIEAQLIRLAQRTGTLPNLQRRWETEVQQTPHDLGSYWKLADLFAQLGDASQEKTWLEKMTALAPEAPEIARRLVAAERATGDAKAAAATMDRLLELQPEESSLVFDRADLDVQLDRPSAAVARLEKLLATRPDDAALERRALAFYERTHLTEPLERHLRADAGKGDLETLALARFLTAAQRTDEARQALLTLVHQQDSPADQAAAWRKIATESKEAGDGAAALQSLRKVVALQPKDSANYVALADALLGGGNLAEARQIMLAAWQIDPSEAIDQKLFQVLQNPPRRSTTDAFDALNLDPPAPDGIGAQTRYLSLILAEAKSHPTTDALLRASRWLAWSGRTPDALAFAQRAQKADPKSLAARKQVLRIALAASNRALAQAQLTALIGADPEHASDWQRQLAQFQLEAGNVSEALATFTALSAADPKDVSAFSQLALAQERADRWSDALATWQRAFALAPASQQREAAAPVLRAMEHLGLLKPAAELLFRIAAETSDPAARRAALASARDFATHHDLSAWYAEELTTRHRKDPTDVAFTHALADLRQSSGDAEGALELLREASEQTPDDVPLLREVVQAALALGRPDEAIAQQRRLVALAPGSDSTEIEALATAEEGGGEIMAATATWQQITAQFSREVGPLRHAADFFLRWQKPELARAALRRIRVLAPGDFAALNILAENADEAESVSCYDQILARSQPPAPDQPLHFPGLSGNGPGGIQQIYFRAVQLRNGSIDGPLVQRLQALWQSGGAELKGDAAVRLRAIEGLAKRLVARNDPAARREWHARWVAAAPGSENLAALFYAGDAEGTMQVLNTLLAADPDDVQVRQAYIWLSFRLGRFAALGAWMQAPERRPDDVDLFLVALFRFADEAPPDARWAEELFSKAGAQTYLRWQTAVLLAEKERLGAAIALGSQAFEAAPAQRVETGGLLAKWQVQTGDLAAARRTLRAAVQAAGSSMEDSVYERLRSWVLLTPPADRASLEADYLRRWHGDPLHAANARLLFAALGEDQIALAKSIEALADLAPIPERSGEDFQTPAELRYWSFFLNSGSQLQTWNLPEAARLLWHRVLRDQASVSFRSVLAPEMIRELRLRTLVADVAAAAPGARTLLLDRAMNELPPDVLASLGTLLSTSGCMEAAEAIFTLNWERDPGNQQALNGLLNTSRALGDRPTLQEALLHALALNGNGPQPEPRRTLAIQAATVLRQNNERTRARPILDDLLFKMPRDPLLLERAGKFAAEDGDDLHAESYLKSALAIQPENDSARRGLVEIYRREGRDEEAKKLAARVSPLPLAGTVGVEGKDDPLSAARQLAADGKKDAAALRLWHALTREMPPERRFELLLQLARWLPGDDARIPALLAQMQQSSREAVTAPLRIGFRDDQSARDRDFYGLGEQLTGENRAAFREIAQAAWQSGKGRPAAGLALLRLELAEKSAPQTAPTMLQVAAGLPGAILTDAVRQLASAGNENLAHQLQQAARRSHPVSLADLGLESARQAVKNAEPSARALLDELSAGWIFGAAPGPGVLAPLYAKLGAMPEARALWKLALEADPTARDGAMWMDYAEFLGAQKDPAAAAVWRRIYANRGNANFTRFLQTLGSDLTSSGAQDALSDLALASWQTPSYWRAVMQRWVRTRNFAAAVDLGLAQPEITLGDAESTDALVTATQKTARFAEITAWLEPQTSQKRSELPWLPKALAAIYRNWAEQEQATDEAAAIKHLERASALTPADFAITKALCQLYEAPHFAKEKQAALQRFLAATRNVKEKAEAERSLRALSLPVE